jgi:mRNA-degrading endonuclease RelE of RelBE toxin-antitoxin system
MMPFVSSTTPTVLKKPTSSGFVAKVVLMTVYAIEVTDLAIEELRELRAFDRRPILEAIRQQLTYEPTVVTRNRKLLEPLVPDFEAVPPIWELRVGDYRIFYDVDEKEKIVYIRAVRYKAPGQTTEDIVG